MSSERKNQQPVGRNPTYAGDWPSFKLGDLISVKHGFAFKSEYFSEEPTAHQLVTPGNFAIGGGFQLGKGKHYSGQVPSDYILNQGDVVVTVTDLSRGADTLGYAAIIPKTSGTVWLHNQRVSRRLTSITRHHDYHSIPRWPEVWRYESCNR